MIAVKTSACDRRCLLFTRLETKHRCCDDWWDAGCILLVLFLVFMVMVLLNLLIAIMSDSAARASGTCLLPLDHVIVCKHIFHFVEHALAWQE